MFIPLLVAVDFMNFTYTVSPCSNVPAPVPVVKGTYSYYDQKMGTGFDVFVRQVKQGSLSAGTQQAVVVLTCDFPIGGTATAFAYDITSKPIYLGEVGGANWGGDWGRGPASIHITFKNNFLYVDNCKDDDCEHYEVRTYALVGGKLVKRFTMMHKPPNN